MIYLLMPGGQQTACEEGNAQQLWVAGQLRPDTLYWKEGMTEWRPLSELFGTPKPKVRVVPRVYRNPLPTTTALQVLLSVSLFVGFIAFNEVNSAKSSRSRDALQGFLAVGSLDSFIGIAIMVVFLCWVYRANYNCRQWGAAGMRFTPGWSVGWFFVPIMNLFRPLQV